MADEVVEEEVKKSSPLLKIILIVVGALVLIAGTAAGTLFATGFFDAKDKHAAEAKLQEMEGEAQKKAAGVGPDGKPIEPQRVTKTAPEAEKFEYNYKEMEKDLVANITGSRKVMQIKLAVMTRYDDRVVKNIERHEMALRSVTLDVMRQTTEADLDKPDFRKELATKIMEAINAKLENLEDFGGVEEVFFTSFVVQ